MARDSTIANAIATDSYLAKREKPSDADLQLFLKEVSYYCPLCGKDLRSRVQKKGEKAYQIAHIFPNRPTADQYKVLNGLPRLGINSESYENKIALCRDCHARQDYHTTKEEYLALLDIKSKCLEHMDLREATFSLGLELEIAEVVKRVALISEEELEGLNYTPVKLVKKFKPNEFLLKARIEQYVRYYYLYIKGLFIAMEGIKGFSLTVLSQEIKSCFIKMESHTQDKALIFEQMVNWVNAKTLNTSRFACEAVVSYFVQNCEVFHEITE